MIVNETTIFFFDASCLVAAAGSPTGGSGFLLSLCTRRLLRGAVSQAVLLEVERNTRTKLRPQALDAYHNLLQSVPLTIAPVPRVPNGTAWLQVINAKDAHVVASALAVRAPYVLTLDQQLGDEINRSGLSIEVITPGDFIRAVLPHHIKYPDLRSG